MRMKNDCNMTIENTMHCLAIKIDASNSSEMAFINSLMIRQTL